VIYAPKLDKATAQTLAEAAHKVCPYSNATRGNIEVSISVVE
jgi:organic hydroperoxide reductase OsmC/OhrA